MEVVAPYMSSATTMIQAHLPGDEGGRGDHGDATLYELEEFTRRLPSDMVARASRRSTRYHKLGVPFRQMHSWDYSGPINGFDGFRSSRGTWT